MHCGFSDAFWFIFSMVYTRGSGSGVGRLTMLGLTNDEFLELISSEVIAYIRGTISEVFLGLLRPQ